MPHTARDPPRNSLESFHDQGLSLPRGVADAAPHEAGHGLGIAAMVSLVGRKWAFLSRWRGGTGPASEKLGHQKSNSTSKSRELER